VGAFHLWVRHQVIPRQGPANVGVGRTPPEEPGSDHEQVGGESGRSGYARCNDFWAGPFACHWYASSTVGYWLLTLLRMAPAQPAVPPGGGPSATQRAIKIFTQSRKERQENQTKRATTHPPLPDLAIQAEQGE